jgi:hypothetical protein
MNTFFKQLQVLMLVSSIVCARPVNADNVIDKVPFVICKSGKWCVKKDLIYTGAKTAITIKANNVTLNFKNHNLILENEAAVGIAAKNVKELLIKQDAIKSRRVSTNPTSAAIFLKNCQKVTLEELLTTKTFRGIRVDGCSDVWINHCNLTKHTGGSGDAEGLGDAIRVVDSEAVVIENTTISNSAGNSNTAPIGIHFTFNGRRITQNRACRISNCKFPNSDIAIAGRSIDGLIVENCSLVAAPTNTFNLIQLGAAQTSEKLGAAFANNIIIRDTTVSASTEDHPFFDGITASNGSSALFENITFDTRSRSAEPFSVVAALHFGSIKNPGTRFASSYSDATVRNCIIKNANSVGIWAEFANQIVIDNTLVTGSVENAIIFEDAVSCVVKNSEISRNLGNGIVLREPARSNELLSNIVSENGKNGIVIRQAARQNHLQGNNVFSNGLDGIDNQSSFNETYFNTSCNNGGDNCSNVTPEQIPGDPCVAGSNICCAQD